MKKIVSMYFQQIILSVVFVLIAAGAVFAAAQSFSFGFIRDAWNYQNDFSYGHGFTSITDTDVTYGYGYGYDGGYRDMHLNPVDYANYGFAGTSGLVTINEVSVTQTTADITYSTNYLARAGYGYGLSTPVTQMNSIDPQYDPVYKSGARAWKIENLTCGTTYYYGIDAIDAGNNLWDYQGSFTTSSCDSATPLVTTGSHGRPQSFGTLDVQSGDKPQFPESPRLEYADFGPGPKLLQTLLNHLGYKVSEYGPGSPGHETEFFGPKTRAALKKFQKAHGLNPDGIYGELTKKAMEAELNK